MRNEKIGKTAMKFRKKLLHAGLVGMLAGSALHGEEGLLTVSAGAKYATGTFGTDYETRSYYIPLIASYIRGGWSFAVTVPYVILDSEGSFTWTPGGMVPIASDKMKDGSGGGTMHAPPLAADTTTEVTATQTSGLGDIVLDGGYTFFFESFPMVKVSAIMKAGTADADKGLGTGENDYSAQISLFRVWDKTSMSLYGGYTFTGDSAEAEYSDVFYASAGMGYSLTPAFSAGLSYFFRESMVEGYDATQNISPYAIWNVTDHSALNLSYAYGLTDTTADHTVGLTFSYYF
jgi:hypothetical protein